MMLKRHAPSKVVGITMCGYECSAAEFSSMLKHQINHVNCKKCLKLLEHRPMTEDDFDATI